MFDISPDRRAESTKDESLDAEDGARRRLGAKLPEVSLVPVEFMPAEPGTHEFTCQMGMLRGRLVVEPS